MSVCPDCLRAGSFVDLFGDVDALFAEGDVACDAEEKRQGAAAAALRAKSGPPEAPPKAGAGGLGGLSKAALSALSVAELRTPVRSFLVCSPAINVRCTLCAGSVSDRSPNFSKDLRESITSYDDQGRGG